MQKVTNTPALARSCLPCVWFAHLSLLRVFALSAVVVSALHWLQCAYSHRVSMESGQLAIPYAQPTAVEFVGPSLRPLALVLAAPCTLAQLLLVWQHVQHRIEAADKSSHKHHERQAVWLLLCQHRHWLDFAFAAFTLPVIDKHESVLHAATSLMALSLAPADAALAAQLQSLLHSTRRRLCVTPLPPADVVVALTAVRQQVGHNEEVSKMTSAARELM